MATGINGISMLKWNKNGIAAAVMQLSVRITLFLPPVAFITSCTAIAAKIARITGRTTVCMNTIQGISITTIAARAVKILVFINSLPCKL